jgi:hypothetical protein
MMKSVTAALAHIGVVGSERISQCVAPDVGEAAQTEW